MGGGVSEVRALIDSLECLAPSVPGTCDSTPRTTPEPAAPCCRVVRPRRDRRIADDRGRDVPRQPPRRARRRRPPSRPRPSPPRAPTRGGRRSRAGAPARRGSSSRPQSAWARVPIRPSTDAAVTWTSTPDSTSRTRRSGSRLHLGVPLRMREHGRDPFRPQREQPRRRARAASRSTASRRGGSAGCRRARTAGASRRAAFRASRTRSRRPGRTSSGMPCRWSSARSSATRYSITPGVGRPVVADVGRARDHRDPVREGRARDLEALLHRPGAVVDPAQDVRMEIDHLVQMSTIRTCPRGR